MNSKVILHDGEKDLFEDLKYLERIGVLSLTENETPEKLRIGVKDWGELNKIAQVVEEGGERTGVALMDEYKKRIDDALLLYIIELEDSNSPS